ncbi:10601_t:CDS:2 [Ambispora leptoticha]|uniref:10601_t:CDS:1 n=1 Tax=Ambispora leptoticha TaxID=144679 RepID=A0A9N9AXD5_9GLOM|nr:10601_t:CDS:2 [Ambispora leptoticha]
MPRYVRIDPEEFTLLQPKVFFLSIIVMTMIVLLFQSNIDKDSLIEFSKNNVVENSFCLSSFNVTKTFGFHNYTEYLRGELPLIIAVPHGGHILPKDLPDLTNWYSEDYIRFNDVNTQELARVVAQQLMIEFGGREVYMVINHLNQRKVDVNRPYEQGTKPNIDSPMESSESQLAWKSYHEFLRNAVDEVEARFGRGLVIDFHGHAHQEEYIEVGYLLPADLLALPVHTLNTNSSIHNSSSIRSLYYRMFDSQITFTSLIRADVLSLGGRLQMLGYHTVPSQAHHYPTINESYLHDGGGGYSVRTYGSSDGGKVDAVQLEIPKKFRIGMEASHRFVVDLADGIGWFFKTYYWGRIEW